MPKDPAVVAQMLIPLVGEAEVSGSGFSTSVRIGPGEAVLWQAGEDHTTISPSGLSALILEGGGISVAARKHTEPVPSWP
ncbi:hypothetical protein [Microbacterium karelineae]|uniref:hypothetical protein n=1 Tax=Microbacterium karelineae TaxID=2654283 RepID=UPI0012EAA28F|nr:hypothetical protein [Microbacterium karelineae]